MGWLRPRNIRANDNRPGRLPWPEAAGVNGMANLVDQPRLRGAPPLQPAEEICVAALVPRGISKDMQPQADVAVEHPDQGDVPEEICERFLHSLMSDAEGQ